MLKLCGISKYFNVDGSNRLYVLDNITVDIPRGSISVFLGRSGCGKTTLLKIIAGLIQPSGGVINFRDIKINNTLKNIGMVFQDFSLFPWLTVKENIEFGLKVVNNFSKKQIDDIVSYYLKLTNLERYENYFPNLLSHGMKQRVAIARTLAVNPDLILMDEPFSALDMITKYEMQNFLINIQKREEKTIIFVTHDIDEAIYIGNEIYVLGGSPTTIKYYKQVEFDKRDMDIRFSSEFVKIKKELIEKMLEN